MGRLIILLAKDFFKTYWEDYVTAGGRGGTVKTAADILLDARAGRRKIPNLEMCDVKITAELRGELAATFGVITFADLFHDSIADVDYTTTKFPKPCKDTDEALVETAKVYNDTCQIIIISDNPTIKEAVKNEQNIGVCTIKEFADAYK